MIPTRLLTSGDLSLNDWVIIELDAESPKIDRHIFGWCPQTKVYQLSSKILEDTEEYIQTRSRKYYKNGPGNPDRQSLEAMSELAHFLQYGWGIPIEEVSSVIGKHSDCIFLGGKIVYDPEVE